MTGYAYNSNNATAGKPGLAISAALMLIMAAISFHALPEIQPQGEAGFCFTSPGCWIESGSLSRVLNAALLLLTAVTAIFLNKQFNFLQTPTLLHASVFLVITGANPYLSSTLCTSTTSVVVIMACTWLLFTLYKSRNATSGIFCIFTMLSWGTTFQHSILLYMPVFIIGAIIMKALRTKEILAAILGIIAPYWALLGLGIVSPEQLSMPAFTNLLDNFHLPVEMFGVVIMSGCTILLGTMFGLNNALRNEGSNLRNHAFNKFLNLLGVSSSLMAIIDYNNMLAYCATINLCVAVQLARLLNHSRTHRENLIYSIICSLYIAAFILIIYV